MYLQKGNEGFAPFRSGAGARKETGMSIREIRELLIAEGERRQRLGLSALNRLPDDRSSPLDASQAPDEEPKTLEES